MQTKKICIVTPDITGPIRNGGVGTAYTALAELLAKDGHEVTVVFANEFSDEESSFYLWQSRYKQKNITLLSLREPEITVGHLIPARRSHAVYEMLKDMDFDIVHFSDLFGVGYFSQQAKRQGLAFHNTIFCVILNGPQSWSYSSNDQLPRNLDTLQVFYLERKSVEWADVLFSPSQYAVDWARAQGWTLPQQTFVEQYVMPNNARQSFAKDRTQFREIVFFGRLETRKGLELFCDAVEKLPKTVLKNTRITFLGRYGAVAGEHAELYMRQRLKTWTCAYEIINDFNQEEAIAYLCETQPLVIVPSKSETLGFTVMECIEIGLPFLASRIPAFQELIDERDHADVLFEENADALATKIIEVLKNGAPQARLRVDKALTDKNWSRWHLALPKLNEKPFALSTSPLVSVCITHKNRPQYLRSAIQSIQAQTYRHFEIIVIDDASDFEAAVDELKRLQSEFTGTAHQVYVQPTPMGPGANRNKAVELAKGEFVLLMDDDNLAKENEIEVLLRVAAKTGADFVSCAFDRFKGATPSDQPTSEMTRFILIGDDINQGLFFNCFGDTNSLYRREAYLQLGGQSTQRGVSHEDYDLFFRAVRQGYRLETCPEALFWYRLHESHYTDQTDPFTSLAFRTNAFTDVFGQDLRPFMLYTHSMNFRHRPMPKDPLRPDDLITTERTDLYQGVHQNLKFVANANERSLVGKNAKITWRKNIARVALGGAGGATLVFSPNTGSDGAPSDVTPYSKNRRHFISLTIKALEPVELFIDYKSEKEEIASRNSRNLHAGKNSLRLQTFNADLSTPLQLSVGSKDPTMLEILDLAIYSMVDDSVAPQKNH